jgi:predicted N-acyltransferase
MKAKQISGSLAEYSPVRVVKIDPRTDYRWEIFLKSTPASWIYYHPIWLELLAEVYGYRPMHLACENARGQLVAILPLFHQRGLHSGHMFRSVFTGPLARDEQSEFALLQAAVEVARAIPGGQLHLKMPPRVFDHPVDGLAGAAAYETYHLALPARTELLRLDSTIRRAVNKALRQGVTVRRAQSEADLRLWYDLYVQTMRRLLVLPAPYRLFELAWRRLSPHGMLRLLLAERVDAGETKLLGGILLLLCGQTVSFDSLGWREEDQALRVNDLLHWQTIHDACAEGLRWYDLGDVALSNQGLARYKRKWGAEALLIYDYASPAHLHAASNDHTPSKHSSSRLVQAVWPHVPARMLEMLAHLYYTLHLY